MQRAADAVRFEMFFEFVASRMAHDVKMPCALGIPGFVRQLQWCPGEQFGVTLRHALAFRRPFCQMLQLHPEHRALKTFHAIIETNLVVIIPDG